MRASEVRILPALDPGESYVDPAFVLVETTLTGDGETSTTIDRVTSRTIDGKLKWCIDTIGQSVPLSHAGALEWAVSFAASRNIPVVYQRDDTRAGLYAATSSRERSTTAASSSK